MSMDGFCSSFSVLGGAEGKLAPGLGCTELGCEPGALLPSASSQKVQQ